MFMSYTVYVFVQMIKEIMAAVTIPVMAKTRVGHFAEAQILQALGVDMVDESEGKSCLTLQGSNGLRQTP